MKRYSGNGSHVGENNASRQKSFSKLRQDTKIMKKTIFLQVVALVQLTALFLIMQKPLSAAGVEFGGAHAGWSASSSTESGSGLGVDLALMPIFMKSGLLVFPGSADETVGYALGFSGVFGFGDAPSFALLEAGRGSIVESRIMPGSSFIGVGLAYRFKKDDIPDGYGFGLRWGFGIFYLNLGLRLIYITGPYSDMTVSVSINGGMF